MIDYHVYDILITLSILLISVSARHDDKELEKRIEALERMGGRVAEGTSLEN